MKSSKKSHLILFSAIIFGAITGYILIELNSHVAISILSTIIIILIAAYKQSIKYHKDHNAGQLSNPLETIKLINKKIRQLTVQTLKEKSIAMLYLTGLLTTLSLIFMFFDNIKTFSIILIVTFASALSILLFNPLASRMGLTSYPDKKSKTIPLIGGISIYAGIAIGYSLLITPNSSSLTYLLCSSIIVALGVAHDIKDLSPKLRLFVQSLVASLMCAGSGMYIHYLGTMFGTSSAIDIGALGYSVTVFAVMASINAFNMIDGIDGLLGISSLVTFVGIGILFFLNEDMTNMKLTLILSGALIPYLIANLAGRIQEKDKRISKTFMGDTGSMLIGFTVTWLLIQGTQPALDGSINSNAVSFSAATALWLIAYPLMDMVRVIVDRILRGQSPLKADRTHFHHILLQCGDSKQSALLKISTLSVFFSAAGIAMHITGIQDVTIFTTFLAAFAVFTVRIRTLQKRLA